jgi:pimeloyl-ACP methyl ester carboxylesterase
VLGPEMHDLGPPYSAMWGPNEFHCTGSLLEWDVNDRLGEIETSALILCGFYDEVTVDVHRTLARGLPNNEFVIFGNSSHVTILEKEADAYLGVIRDFVRRTDGV